MKDINSPATDIQINQTGEFFADFIDFLIKNLQKNGLSNDCATETAIRVSVDLASHFSGETFYVSRKPLMLATQMSIYADLQRMPSADVDMKYGVSKGYSTIIGRKINQAREKRKQLKESVKIV